MSNNDPTINDRVARQRTKRLALGWKKVTVWVQNEEQAEAIRAMGRKFREVEDEA